MKTVFNNRMVCHVWAQREQREGRNAGGSLYFEGDTLYSYGAHFPIARHETMPDGRAVVLFNARSYSPTTGKHQSYALGAVRGGSIVITLPDSAWDDTAAAREYFADAIADAMSSAKRARKYTAQHLERVGRLVETANLFAELRGEAWRIEAPADLEAAQAAAAAERAERLERERVAEDARRAEALRRMLGELRETHADYVAWRRGERSSCPAVWRRAARFHRLALSADGETVTTTGGASFPADHARRAAAAVLQLLERGGEPTRALRLGHFTIDAADAAAGVLRAGCHVVRFAEVRRLARQLGAVAA